MLHRYEEMKFTDNDKARLRENKEVICQWIMENIVPLLNEDDRIYIDYGGTYRSGREYSWSEGVAYYHFAVYGRENEFRTGGGTRTKGYIGCGQKYGRIEQAFEKVFSPYDIYPVVDNWQIIKNKLISEAKRKKDDKKSIYAFEV